MHGNKVMIVVLIVIVVMMMMKLMVKVKMMIIVGVFKVVVEHVLMTNPLCHLFTLYTLLRHC